MFNFPANLVNDASKAGQPAAGKQYFGENNRYGVCPVHTRYGELEWFVWDAEHPFSTLSHAEVVRQEPTLELAVEGLVPTTPAGEQYIVKAVGSDYGYGPFPSYESALDALIQKGHDHEDFDIIMFAPASDLEQAEDKETTE